MSDQHRLCSRTVCQREATSTLTYAYADSTAVIGPLATRVEPHAYDLCEVHAARLTVPRGWEILRLPGAPQAPEDTAAGEDPNRHPAPEDSPVAPRLSVVRDGTRPPS